MNLTEFLPWLLVAACGLAIVFVVAVTVLLVKEKKKHLTAELMYDDEAIRHGQKKKEYDELTAQARALETELASEQETNRKHVRLLSLITRAHEAQEGRVGAFAFDTEGGELLASAADEGLVALLTDGGANDLREVLTGLQADADPEAFGEWYLSVSHTEEEGAEVYVVTDVTDTCRLPQLQRESEEKIHALISRDPFTQVTSFKIFLEEHQAMLAEGRKDNLFMIYLQSEPVVMPNEVLGGYKAAYLKTCAAILANAVGPQNVSRYGEAAFCCMFEAETPEAAREIADRISDEIGEKRKELWPADDRLINQHILILAHYSANDLAQFIFCLDVKAKRDLQRGRFGVQEFARTSYAKVMAYKNQIETVIEKRQVRFFYRPISTAVDARVFGYELVPFFPTMSFKDTDELIHWAQLLGYTNRLEEVICTGAMQLYTKAVDNAQLLGSTRILLQTLNGACMVKKAEEEFHEANYDLLPHFITELSERLPEGRVVAELKRRNIERWGAWCCVRCDEDMMENGLKVGFLNPNLVRISMEVVRSLRQGEQIKHLFERIHQDGGKVMVDGIKSSVEVEMAINAGADFLQGEYVGRTGEEPGELTEKCMSKIGLIQFGKKG